MQNLLVILYITTRNFRECGNDKCVEALNLYEVNKFTYVVDIMSEIVKLKHSLREKLEYLNSFLYFQEFILKI